MELFESSGIWSIAIGKTMVHSLWIGFLILALFRFALASVPVRLSRIRYAMSVATLFLLFFSSLTVFLFLYEPVSSGHELPGIKAWLTRETGETLASGGDSAILQSGFLFTFFGYVYILGVLLMLGRSALSLASVRNLQNKAWKPSEDWQSRFVQICKNLGIKRYVNFLESDMVQGPLLIAYLKPAVIVPAGMLSHLPVDQVETILVHELYHLKRRDYLVNIMQLFIEGILFYHPVAWLISASIRSEREHCCDDGVLRFTDNPLKYAKALLHLAEEQNFSRLTPGAVGSDKHQFPSRIKRILNYDTMKTNMRDKVLALSMLAGSLLLMLTISSFSAAPSFIKNRDMLDASVLLQDTIREKEQPAEIEEIEEPDWEAIREEIEETRMEALEEMEEALAEIEEIDWEAINEEMEEARAEALEEIEEIDWEAIKEEMEEASAEALAEIEEIDWEAMKAEIKESHKEAMKEIEEIDWEEIRAEMELDLSEMKMDMDAMKLEIQKSMDEIDWEEIKVQIQEDLEKVRQSLDSMKIELDR
jgi:beta-lactamase regulating signal transducer with metallopeptidase domain